MTTNREHGGTGSPQGGDSGPWLLIGGLVLLMLAWPQLKHRAGAVASSAPVVHALSYLPAVLAVACVLVVLWLVLRARHRRRAWKRAMLSEAVEDLLKRGYDPDSVLRDSGVSFGLSVTRWGWYAQPRRVRIDYPASMPDHDPRWRLSVEEVVQRRAGWDRIGSQWEENLLRVTLTQRPVERSEEVGPEAAASQAYAERATRLLAPIFGVAIRVSVLAWEPAQERDRSRFPEGYPASLAIDYEPMTRDTSVAWRRRLEAVVALKTPPGDARWVGHYDTAGDRIILEHAPTIPSRIVHPGPSVWANTVELTLPYGVDADGGIVRWSLTGPRANLAVHMLIVGATGGGKTTVIRSLVTSSTGQGIHVVGADPKRIELSPFRGWPGVHAVASDPADIGELIRAVHNLMTARYDAIETTGAKSSQFDFVVFILDELLILRASLDRWWVQNKEAAAAAWGGVKGSHHPALALLDELIVLARSANIRLALGVQRPDADLFERGSRDSVRHRVGMNRLSQEGARMLWGDPYTGTDLPLIPGRAMASPEGEPIETQTFWVPNPNEAATEEERTLIQKLQAEAARAFAGKELPAGLDLSQLSQRALEGIDAPPAGSAAEVEMGEVVEHAEDLTTQDVAADELMAGDRIYVDGEVETVLGVEAIDDPSGDEYSDIAWVAVDVLPGTVRGAQLADARAAYEAGKALPGSSRHEGPDDESRFARIVDLDAEG